MKYLLLTALLMLLSLPCLAQTTDCEDAQAACRTKCDVLGLQEFSGGTIFTVDVWKDRCRNACDKGAEACRTMSASAGCQGYFHHCRAECPVTGGETDKAYDGTDAFFQCQNACAGGKTVCGATNKKLKVARERTVSRNVCDETQSACKAQCAANVYVKDRGRQMPSAFYKECTNACGKSHENCAVRTMDSSTCGAGLKECYRHSPGTELNKERNYYQSVTDEGEWYMGACEEASEYCRAILGDHLTNTTKVE